MSRRRLLLHQETFAAVDLETTGFSHAYDRVIEIAAVKIRQGRIGPVFHTLIYADYIPWQASRVHGIYPDMLRNAPSLAQVRPLFRDFVRDCVLVGHNIAGFDMRFLCGAFGVAADHPVVDTLRWSRQLFPRERSHGLAHAAARFGISSPRFHRAREDALVSAQLFLAMLKHGAPAQCGTREKLTWKSGRKN